MAPLKVEQYVVGPVQTNCYFAINDDTKEVLVIDPGASADQTCQEDLSGKADTDRNFADTWTF